MNEQAYQQTIEAHKKRIQAIAEDLDQLLREAKEITAELQRLCGERTQQKTTVQHG